MSFTLYFWPKQTPEPSRAVPSDGRNPEQWSGTEKITVVLVVVPLNETELAAWCQGKHLPVEQLGHWRTDVHKALSAG